MNSKYKIYEVRFLFVNFSIIVEDNIVIMSPLVNGFVGMNIDCLKEKVSNLNGHINRVSIKF